MKKATIKKYYQVVDEKGIVIDNAHTYKQAVKIKNEYEFKQKKKRIDITAYRKRMGDFDEGSTLKEHKQIDKDRRGDWG